MQGQVFTIAKLHYINGVLYHVEQSERAKIDEIAGHYTETTKSGKAKHPRVRVRTLARFAAGLGLIDFVDRETITLTALGKDYCRSKHINKWALSEDQKRLLRDHILDNPSRTKTIFAIISLLNLVSTGLKGTELTQKYAEAIGKQDLWNSTATFDGFTEFGSNYLQELGFIDTAGNSIQGIVPSITTAIFDPGLRAGDTLTNDELTSIFKCSPQGGMRRARRTNSLVIISDHTKSIYEDRWIDGIMHYTGMGMEGDQSLTFSQNKTLAESASNGVALYFFEVFQRGLYTFMGQVALSDDPYQEQQPDKENDLRSVWVFPLGIIGEQEPPAIPAQKILQKEYLKAKAARRLSDDELRRRAKYAKKGAGKRRVEVDTFERNPYVAELAKRLANGICQLCDQSAPFKDKKGNAFLETHHIVWLSNAGEDTIENTVALCPNCHRKMHSLDSESDIAKLKAVKKQEIR